MPPGGTLAPCRGPKRTDSRPVRTILFGPFGIRDVRFLHVDVEDVSNERQSLGTWGIRQATILYKGREPEADEDDTRYPGCNRGSKRLHNG